MAKRCQLFRFQASWLTTRSYNILFFGSDEFSIASLSAIHRQKYASGEPLFKHLQVVTPPVSRWEIDKCSYLVITAKLYNFAKNELDLVVHQAPPRTLNGWALPKTPDGNLFFTEAQNSTWQLWFRSDTSFRKLCWMALGTEH